MTLLSSFLDLLYSITTKTDTRILNIDTLELPPLHPPLSLSGPSIFIWVFWTFGVGVATTIIFSGSGVGIGSSSIFN